MRNISEVLLGAIENEAVYKFIHETFQAGNIEDVRTTLIDEAHPMMAPEALHEMYKFHHPNERIARWMSVSRADKNDSIHIQYLVSLRDILNYVSPSHYYEVESLLDDLLLPLVEQRAPQQQGVVDFIVVDELHLVGTVINYEQYQATIQKAWRHLVTMQDAVNNDLLDTIDDMGGLRS